MSKSGSKIREQVAHFLVDIHNSLIPETNTSMQRDVAAGHRSEVDGLIYEMVRLGNKYNVPVPCYTAVAEEMKRRGLE